MTSTPPGACRDNGMIDGISMPPLDWPGAATIKEEDMKLAAITFITGLILAGSDGPWFPWVNFAGVIVFSMSPVLAWRAERRFG